MLIQRIIKKVKRELLKLHKWLDPLLVKIASKSGMLSSLYYVFYSQALRREHRAVLLGRLKFMETSNSESGNQYMLRRSIHRLEKGLLMSPGREVFALKYIQETVAEYKRILDLYKQDEKEEHADELRWAHDTLVLYFETVNVHETIEKAKDLFQKLEHLKKEGSVSRVPYKRDLSMQPPVSIDSLMKLAMHRKSVRWFLPKPVPREVIDNAIKVASYSPAACNRQAFSFRIFDDKELMQKVANIPMGTAGYSQNIPVITVLIGHMGAFIAERDRHLIYIDGCLAAMPFILALESQGISTCCINWPDMEEQEQQMAKVLGLNPEERPVMLIALGYPDPQGLVAYSQKKSLNELRKYNFE